MSAQHSTLAECLMPDPDFKCNRHGHDLGFASHGPNVVILSALTAFGDRWLDSHVGYDPDGGSWCDGGYVVQRGQLHEVLEMIELDGLTVEKG